MSRELYNYKRKATFSSPSRGSYISTKSEQTKKQEVRFSSPSRGSYISTIVIAIIILIVTVLVPFPGFLYLYDISDYLDEYWGWFSSPSRGSYISTMFRKLVKKRMIEFSSPSRGSYISTKMNNVTLIGRLFSSPSRGSYISTDEENALKKSNSSRPLPGVLISLLLIDMS